MRIFDLILLISFFPEKQEKRGDLEARKMINPCNPLKGKDVFSFHEQLGEVIQMLRDLRCSPVNSGCIVFDIRVNHYKGLLTSLLMTVRSIFFFLH